MLRRELGEERVAETGGFAAEHDHVVGAVRDVVVPAVRIARRRREPTSLRAERGTTLHPAVPHLRAGELVIVEAAPAQRGAVEVEAQRSHEMQLRADIRTEPDDAAGVRRDLRRHEHDVEHLRMVPCRGPRARQLRFAFGASLTDDAYAARPVTHSERNLWMPRAITQPGTGAFAKNDERQWMLVPPSGVGASSTSPT